MLEGRVEPDYAGIVATLIRRIPSDGRSGAALCVYHQGRCVVDVWGGARDRSGAHWQADTLAPCFSTGKGVLATLLHVLVYQGRAAYDDPIARHWPAFGAAGKESITLRDALCHRAGLHRITDLVDSPAEMRDWELMKARIAAARPTHHSATVSGYHALTWGWLIGGLIEELSGRTLARTLHDELVRPLQLDGAWFGVPRDQLHRCAELLRGTSRPRDLSGTGQALRAWAERALRVAGVHLEEFDAALNPFSEPFDWNAEQTVMAAIPAANGQFTARSLARVYALLADGGELDGVRLIGREQMATIARVDNHARDRVLTIPMRWRLGYHRVFALGASAPNGFGHFGYGGSGAFCDPERRLAVALAVNKGAGTPMGNSNLPRLAGAAIRTADRLR